MPPDSAACITAMPAGFQGSILHFRNKVLLHYFHILLSIKSVNLTLIADFDASTPGIHLQKKLLHIFFLHKEAWFGEAFHFYQMKNKSVPWFLICRHINEPIHKHKLLTFRYDIQLSLISYKDMAQQNPIKNNNIILSTRFYCPGKQLQQ